MAYTTINKSTDYFNTKLYTGNGTAMGSGGHAITGVGHQPDFVWIKDRSAGNNHNLYDVLRGVQKGLQTSNTGAEYTNTEVLNSFNSDGFTVGDSGGVNTNSNNYAAWNWKANGAGSSNSDGSITSTVSANTTAGFSIVKYTGTGATATVGHGLGAIPAMMIIKRYSDSGEQWTIYHKSLGNTKHILFTTGSSTTQTNYWNDTSPTNAVWTMGNQSEINGSGATNICYAFTEKTGYSKFGSYTGTGDADGPFVYTGFKPALVITKQTDSTGNWHLFDNKRPNENPTDKPLNPNTSDAETDEGQGFEFLSNGFKIRESGNWVNAGGGSFIFMAFGQSLVGSNNIPCTAR